MSIKIEGLRDIFNVLCDMGLSPEKLLLAGSAPLYAVGILEGLPQDLDILVRDKRTWRKITALRGKELEQGPRFPETAYVIERHAAARAMTLEFVQNWPMAGRSQTALFNDAVEMEEAQYMSLRDVVVTKRVLDRPKDREHLDKISEWTFTARSKLAQRDENGKSLLSGRVVDENIIKRRITFQQQVLKSIKEGLAFKLPPSLCPPNS